MFLLVSPHSVVGIVAQLCPTLGDPMDCIPAGSSVHGILQARTLEWVAISLLLGIFQNPGIEPWVSCIAGKFFTIWATREALFPHKGIAFPFVCQASSFPLITAAETNQVFLLGVPAPSHPSLEAPQPPGSARTEQLTGLWHHKTRLCCVFPGH